MNNDADDTDDDVDVDSDGEVGHDDDGDDDNDDGVTATPKTTTRATILNKTDENRTPISENEWSRRWEAI